MSTYADVSIDPTATALPAPRAQSTWLLVAAPLVAFAAQFVATDSYYTALTKIYAGSLAALTAFALARLVTHRTQRVPAIEYALVHYYLAFGLAVTLGPSAVGSAQYTPHADAFETASGLALGGAIAMLVGHAAWRTLPDADARRRYLPKLTPQILDSVSLPYILVGSAFVVALAVAPSIKIRIASVLAIVQLLIHSVPVVTVATIAYALWPRVRTLALLTIAIGVCGLSMIVTSMIGEALMPLVAVATIWWRFRGKFPVVLVGCGIAVFYILQPVKGYYRAIAWDGRNEGVGVIDRWQQAFSMSSADRNKQSGGDATRERLSELATFAYVTELVPQSLPYFGGDVYERAVTAIIPRVFWSEKPNMTKEGLDRYTIALGITEAEMADRSTVGLQLVTHGYASHGIFGSFGWMLLYGIVVGAVNRLFGQGFAGTIATVGFMTGWIPNIGLGFVGCFGSLPQVIISLIALVWILWLLGRFMQSRQERAPFARASGAIKT